MRRNSLWVLFVLSLFWMSGSMAAGGNVKYSEPSLDRSDFSSLQRGAAIFTGYCMGCHSAKYVRYGHISEDLKIPEEIMNKNFLFNRLSLGDSLNSSILPGEAKEWFYQAIPPDLSLSARLRGTAWLYAYLRNFYRDDSSASGWNNSVFPNVAMPHVFSDLQGEIVYSETDKKLIKVSEGELSAVEYDLLIADLVNFMDYMADPNRESRHRAGYVILFFLTIFLVFSYFLYREYWRDIH